MKKHCFVLFLLIFSVLQIWGQKKNIIYAEIGGSFSSFQDTKYSKVRYNGFGIGYRLGYIKESEKNMWGVHIQNLKQTEKPSTHDMTQALTRNLMIQTNYLKKIKENLYIGGTWDILDYYTKEFENLGNNSVYSVSGSTLWASGIYKYKKFNFGLSIGLISYYKENLGFAFVVPQSVLENGEFDYQNLEEIDDIFNFKDYKLRTINKNFQLRTKIRYQLSKRFSIGYQWNFRRFSEVKKHPVTYGIHALSIRYNILNKEK